MKADMYVAALAGLALYFKQIRSGQTTGWVAGGRATSKEDDWLLPILIRAGWLTAAFKEGLLSKNVEIVQHLLETGSDPNWKARNKSSSWEWLLTNLLLTFTKNPVQHEDDLSQKDRREFGLDREIISASLDLLPVFLRSGAQSEDPQAAKVPIPTKAGAKKLALAHIEKLANGTSPADGQLYLKVIEARKTLLEMPEILDAKSTRQKKSSFRKLFSSILRKTHDTQTLSPVNAARSTVAR
jgi:hypothetical protein